MQTVSWQTSSLRRNLPAQDGSPIYIDDFAGHEVGQVGGEEENGAGNLFGRAGAAQGNGGGDGFAAFFGVDDGIGHIGGHPAGGHAVHQDIVAGEFAGEAFDQADDAALRGPVMGVEGFAALAGSGADGNEFAGFLLDHLRDGKMNDGVDAFQVDANHVVPLLF